MSGEELVLSGAPGLSTRVCVCARARVQEGVGLGGCGRVCVHAYVCVCSSVPVCAPVRTHVVPVTHALGVDGWNLLPQELTC